MTVQLVSEPACLPEAIERIRRQFYPVRIILFGWWARGQARPDSDLGFALVLPHVENKRRAAVEIMRALNGLPSVKISSSPLQRIAARGNTIGHVLRPALREGKSL